MQHVVHVLDFQIHTPEREVRWCWSKITNMVTAMFPQPTRKSDKLFHTTADLQIQLFFPLFPSF